MTGALAPVAVGFFGLGTGYLVWGGSALTGFPKEKGRDYEKSMGLWGVWMPGFCQFFAGVYLFLGLTVFPAFEGSPVLYMAALAFTVFGIHWFSMGWRRYIGADATPDGFMAIAFLWISLVGAYVFFTASPADVPVAIVFVFLTFVYLCEVPARLLRSAAWSRGVATVQVLGGAWLMYLTLAAAANFANGAHFWL